MGRVFDPLSRYRFIIALPHDVHFKAVV